MAASQVQTLLRFLSQDAKVPLAMAMGKIMDLQRANLMSAEQISKSDLKPLQEIFKDEKTAKQVLNAAKRVTKKRKEPTEATASPQKKTKRTTLKDDATPFEKENALSLPSSSATEEELSKTVLCTNRAPLVLAFAVCVLKYTMPEQPISSRLSLAQAIVSANSRSKAISLGIESGQTAEQEGWGEGQPVVKVLGREIKILKRWGYNPKAGEDEESHLQQGAADALGKSDPEDSNQMPPVWGVDLEELRDSKDAKANKPLPIFTPESARSYLFKSFTEIKDQSKGSPTNSKGGSTAQLETEKETCLGRLLRVIDMVYVHGAGIYESGLRFKAEQEVGERRGLSDYPT
ncbi:hypothetical protein ASPWEDRAFT_25030 [Aspergillus wentii DTO 134E9]|uniref:Impact N-terminal domain-containing protein n=1 Tax=Aspergillus wentii DTO 134E9 TaxID=1073089 RepID=A0A1L9RWD5_ASPWE|nr:uncharacterized protein ASPWEDRAFT_25030 [Aspergillus wentii DTO 134E9]OJJ39177.1 hypothetical protein ASPWEDRAFT_25030 [Aspergillus wentii DTO 134E9]